jgi:GMP synthase (glutamine-hydrolysing)
MPERLLLISHNPPPMEDRAASCAKARGFTVDARYPFMGDALPASLEDHAGSVVYGGRFNTDSETENPFLRDEYRWIEQSLAADLPMLGICLGSQMIARALGASVGPFPDARTEFGFYEVRPVPGAEDFLPGPLTVTQSHFHGFSMPDGATRLAESDLFPNQAFRHGPRVLGLQFHPEATPTQFRRWQETHTAHYARPGCQPRAEQDALIDAAQAPQAAWFTGVLESLFGGAMARAD